MMGHSSFYWRNHNLLIWLRGQTRILISVVGQDTETLSKKVNNCERIMKLFLKKLKREKPFLFSHPHYFFLYPAIWQRVNLHTDHTSTYVFYLFFPEESIFLTLRL